MDGLIPLCNASDLREAGTAIPFDVVYGGQTCRAFAVRFKGAAHAYLNRCTHVGMELDWQPGRVFDGSGQWLVCGHHGAAYQPETGACSGGPCRGGLVKVILSESGGVVYWHSAYNLQPIQF
ncbi:MAG: Rieske (2Fe-2S) protein [Comamonadaceae bacterium]|nr:MAG: Rieske (2Fe-2S) protein [Comamonadaceae bacterium]